MTDLAPPNRPQSHDAARRSLLDAYHVLMGEVYGWISGQALLRIARHANSAHDPVTVWRVREIIARGVEVGWADAEQDAGRIVPRREREVAKRVIAEIERRVAASRG